jgi:tRNA(adenine34) deaminase
MKQDKHQFFLKEALRQARKAFLKNEVPIGAVIVDNDEVVGKGYNQTKTSNKILRHAEIVALESVAKKTGDWRLDKMKLYVTVEPCLMCLGATILSRITEIHYVIDDPTFGSIRSVIGKVGQKGSYKNIRFFQHPELADEVTDLMKEFFKNLRKRL